MNISVNEIKNTLKMLKDGDEVLFSPNDQDIIQGVLILKGDEAYIAHNEPGFNGEHPSAALRGNRKYAWIFRDRDGFIMTSEISYLAPVPAKEGQQLELFV